MERRALLIAGAVALSVALLAAPACGDDGEPAGTTGTATADGLGPPSEGVHYGRIESLEQEGGGYVLRFDPALFLAGETANVAAAEDGVVEPGEPVPNDYYVVDESDRLFTYLVADDAEVTVLTRTGDQFGPTPISVPELAEIVAGTSGLELFEPLDTGVWITVDADTVRSIHHQYRP